MNGQPVKPLVVHLLHQTREEEVAFGAALTEDERAALGAPDLWSATYTLAHLTAAKRRLTEALRTRRRGDAPSLEHDEAQVYAENQGRTWDEVEAEAQNVFVTFVAEVERLTDAELTDGEHDTVIDGRPLAAQILGHGVWHPYGHLRGYYHSRRDQVRARHIEQRLTDAVDRLEPSPMVRRDSVTLYNMACVQATAGRQEKALALLEEALMLDPDLRQNAESDPDLTALRGNAYFQAVLFG